MEQMLRPYVYSDLGVLPAQFFNSVDS